MKILIVRVGAFGDVLHALPAAAALKQKNPNAQIDWVIDERWRPLVSDDDLPGPIVTTSFSVPTRAWKAEPLSRATLGSIANFRKLRGHYDAVIDMQGTMRSAVIGRFAGGRKLAGYADPREALAASFYGRKIIRRGTHVVDQGAALLRDALGDALGGAPGGALSLSLTPADFELPRIAWAEQWAEHEAVQGRPMALLAAGGGWAAKRWPTARFAELAIALRDRGYDVIVNTPRKDDPEPSDIVAASGGAARVVVCNVAGLVALMRRADLVVGGDSGPTHLAAALAVPTIALFGPTDPQRNGPWGPGPKRVLRNPSSLTTYKRSAAPDPGLERIGTADVLSAIDEMLG